MKTQPIYHLDIYFEKCLIKVYINGFPLFIEETKSPLQFAPPINHLLVGEGNIVELEIYPTLLDDGKLSTVDNIEVEGSVKLFKSGDIVAPENGEPIFEFIYADVIKDPDIFDFPIKYSAQFDNSTINFGEVFLNGKTIEDEDRIISYGEYLLNLLSKKDIRKIDKQAKNESKNELLQTLLERKKEEYRSTIK